MSTNLDIPHGGWIPKGRMTEKDPLSEKYNLQEMPTSSYPERTEQLDWAEQYRNIKRRRTPSKQRPRDISKNSGCC